MSFVVVAIHEIDSILVRVMHVRARERELGVKHIPDGQSKNNLTI